MKSCNTWKQLVIFVFAILICNHISFAQNKKDAAKVATKTVKDIPFKKMNASIEYKIFDLSTSKEILKDSDFVRMHIIQKIGDSILMSTFVNPGSPVLNQIIRTLVATDPTDVIDQMHPGDSAVIRYTKDSIFRSKVPSFVKPNDEVLLILKIVSKLSLREIDSIKTERIKQEEAQMLMAAEQAEQEYTAILESNKDNIAKEAATIEAYLKSNNMVAQKTKHGIYYVVTKQGSGANAGIGKNLTMNYTGTTLDGKAFDSNIDPQFNHVQPFTFTLGVGQVIKGWDEGISYLNKDSKATLIIPSYLAYGAQEVANGAIKANSILRFDLEVVDFN